MLTSALKELVKNSVKKSFDIAFMENKKNYQNINIILNQYSKGTC